MTKLKVLIAAGGSGGHIFPAVALARRLMEEKRFIDILFVGSDKSLDKRLFEKEGFRFFLLSANKFPHKLTAQIAPFFINLFFDVVKTFHIIFRYRPDVVVGFGGYVSFTTLFASYILRIPRIVHEQNVLPGRANRISFKMADEIAISFEETRRFLDRRDGTKAVFTGNPIRQDVLKDDKENGLRKLGLDRNKFTILVIGGSQGAHFLNEAFINALLKISDADRGFLQVIHITGLKDYDWAMREYGNLGLGHRVYSFIDRIEEAYSASDLIVARSGASCIFEIAYFGRPMILVPYPFAMSHQVENANVFSEKGAAIKIDEHILSADLFKEKISLFLNDRERLKKIGESAKKLSVPDASGNLARLVLKYVI